MRWQRPRQPTSVTIRSYQVGFGDCFLVSFNYGEDGKAERRHVLIDFGSTGLPTEGRLLARRGREGHQGEDRRQADRRRRDPPPSRSHFRIRREDREADRRSQPRCRRAAVDRGSQGAARRDGADGRAEGREGIRRCAGRHARRRAVFAAGGRRASRAEDGEGTDCVSRRRQPRESRRDQDADGHEGRARLRLLRQQVRAGEGAARSEGARPRSADAEAVARHRKAARRGSGRVLAPAGEGGSARRGDRQTAVSTRDAGDRQRAARGDAVVPSEDRGGPRRSAPGDCADPRQGDEQHERDPAVRGRRRRSCCSPAMRSWRTGCTR